YVAKILRKFGLTDGKSASAPIDTEKPLLKDPDDIMFVVCACARFQVTPKASHLHAIDIMFVVCACARFQVTPKASHLHAVKKIFRYLKGKPHLGLWYPKDLPFNLVVYSDSDYAEASLDRKSTTGGCQFLGNQSISSAGIQNNFTAELSTQVRDLNDNFEEFFDNNTNGVNAASTSVTAVGPNSTNSTNTFSVASPSNTAVSPTFRLDGKSLYVDPSTYPNDSDMLALEDITYLDDEEDVGAEADFSNLET
nr:hypothetical protein [Tanacetum cinerariifolium]